MTNASSQLPSKTAVLFDRDGTLIEDVAYNGDPAAVRPVEGAERALRRLRDAGYLTGVVSNQSGVGRGLLTVEQMEAVNRRVDELLGPFDVWRVCKHAPEAACGCRKPEPGLISSAAEALGLQASSCVVIGDIGSDMAAAQAAGARAILVPTAVTRSEEVAAAPLVAQSLERAVSFVLAGTQ